MKQECKFSEITINHDKKRIPLSANERKNKKGEYPYYGAQGIIDYVDDYIFDGEYLLIAEDGENLRSRLKPIAQVVSGKFWVNNHAHIVQCKENCDIYYLESLLNNMDISKYITGSAQPKLNQRNLNNMVLKLPDFNTQLRFSEFIKLINHKINLNNKINKNLELQTQEIFKFIYTNYEENNYITLKEICSFKKGKKPKLISENKEDENFDCYLTIDALSDLNKTYALNEKVVNVNEFDILMVMDGASSGKLFFGKSGILGSTLSKIEVLGPYEEFVYQLLKFNESFIFENNTGSTIPHTDKELVLNLKCPLPKNINEISNLFKKIRYKIILNKMENDYLTDMKNFLIPLSLHEKIEI